MGRFVNADGVIITKRNLLDINSYCYCLNNPLNRVDHNGCWSLWGAIIGVAIAAVGIAAAVVAAPLVTAAVAAGYVAGVIYTAGVVACGVTATVCGAAKVQEAVTGENFLKDVIGEEAAEDLTVISTMGSLQGLSSLYVPKEKEPIGKPFDSNGPKYQEGVDPYTLAPSKDLSTLNRQRLSNAYKYGRDIPLSVYKSGIIEDGHHRLQNARQMKFAVDVFIMDK